LCRAAERAGIALIEDAAQAHGATWLDRRAGAIGCAGCFSFYPAKNLGAFGDAGAVVTSDAGLASRVGRLRDHGRTAHHRHAMIGTNSRLDALQAVVLSAKLARLDAWNQARRCIAHRYREALRSGPARLLAELTLSGPVYHLAVARVPHRDRAQARLRSMGVETGVHYPTPCHQQGPYLRFATGPLPVAEQAAGEILSLPMFPHLSEEQLARVVDALGRTLAAEESDVA
jgi:dTDP-4-amino-4,6-dideoxygalactose transaminase